ncbi:Malonyl CoA-acyl carrier protein transacylase [Myxococcus hansupus]|uniref:Malonyl CoA-acyl carrier protein transacylase n=1 Tax=Pseudomyxococcus hansupus TaxID=1297742 RepID=A0A0H4WQK4_9BACT|nr:SDR family NAD(P)-dependent oxidoreductase [Myxococcus hansupus]AKQ65801.1 Malonyl CoA-acyl carrier protein transacylase [Myxococcus hansupus]
MSHTTDPTGLADLRLDAATAVIGMACRFPDARDAAAFWSNLHAGHNSVTEVPPERWDVGRWYSPDITAPDRSPSRWGAFLGDFDRFDHGFFNVSPREARNMDPQQRLLLEETWHCIEDAGVSVPALTRARTAVYVGAMAMDHYQSVYAPGVETEGHACAGAYACMLANRVSYHLGLRGESLTLDTACSSSLVALHQARRALLLGEADYCLVAGVSLDFSPWKYVSFGKSRMLSPTGQCRTFDKDADGYVPGEGVGVLLLRRLTDAERDGNAIHGVIRGTAVNHVGRAASLTAPRADAQRDVILAACRDANVEPSTLTYVEAHGTGTSLGDPVEVSALTEAFRTSTDQRGFCGIGSVKTNIGHLEAAAGVAGLIKVLLMMRHAWIPATLNLQTRNPLIDFDGSPFVPVTQGQPWVRANGAPLRAGVSSFGFGGVNSHAVVEEYRPAAPPAVPGPDDAPFAFVLSARTESGLQALRRSWAERCRAEDFDAVALRDACLTLQSTQRGFKHRFSAVVRTPADLVEKLESDTLGARVPVASGPLTLVFGALPDGGLSAARSLYGRDPLFEKALDARTGALLEAGNLASMAALLDLPAVPEELRPALALCVQGAFAESLEQCGAPFRRFAGESLTALVAAGALPFDETLRAVLPGGGGARVELRRPLVACLHPLTGEALLPWEADKERLQALIDSVHVGSEDVRRSVSDARLLFGSQHTFSRHLEEWRAPLVTVRRDLDALLAGPSPSDERVAGLVLATARLRVDRKWSLAGTGPVDNAALVALAALVADGHLLHDESLRLLLSPRSAEDLATMAQALARRLNETKAQGPCLAARGPGEPLRDATGSVLVSSLMDATPVSWPDVAGPTLALGTPRAPVSPATHVLALDGDVAGTKLKVLTALWRAGADIDWERLADGCPYRPFRLPGYVFEGPRFPPARTTWPDPHTAARASDTLVPVPLEPASMTPPFTDAAQHATQPMEGTWRPEHPIIRDHRITGHLLVPGAELLRAAIVAARRTAPAAAVLSGVSFHTPKLIDAERPYTVDTEVPGRFVVRTADTQICTGMVALATAESLTRSQEPLPEPGVEAVTAQELYARLAEAGYDYGDSLRVIRRVQWSGGRFVAQLRGAPDTGAVDAALLDGVLQCVVAHAALSGRGGQGTLLIPYFIQRLQLSGALRGDVTVELRDTAVREQGADLRADIRVRTPGGGEVLELEGAVFRRVSKDFLSATEPLRTVPRSGPLEGASLYAPRWLATEPPAPGPISQGVSLLLLPPGADAHALKGVLAELGEVIVARASSDAHPGEQAFDPEDPTAWSRLVSHASNAATPSEVSLRIYSLLAAGDATPATVDELWGAQAHGARALFLLAKAAGASRFKSVRIAISAPNGFSVQAGDSVRGHASASLLGAARTLALEYRKLRPVVIDAGQDGSDDVSVLRLLRQESLAASDAEHVVAYRDTRRFVARVARAETTSRDVAYREGGVFLIVGGAGGLGRKTAAHIARRTRGARIALVGRSPASAAISSAVQELQGLGTGTQVRYFATDVTQPEALAASLAEIRQALGPIRGVIHSGGVLEDRLMFSKDAASFDRVLRPKVLGAWLLDRLTATDPLDFFIAYSSVVSELGNVGQVDYAAANAFLDAFMDFRRAQGRPGRSLSVNWTLWADGGMGRDAHAIEQLAARGITALEDGPAFAALDAALTSPEARLIVLGPGTAHPFGERLLDDHTVPTRAAPITGDGESIEASLRQLFAERLEADATTLDRTESFFALGVDSVMVKDLMRELDRTYDGLSPTLLFERSNLQELAAYLSTRPVKTTTPEAPRPATPEVRHVDAPLAHAKTPDRAIAIIGMSGRFPKAPNLDAYWSNLLAGRDCITEVPADRWDAQRHFHPDPANPDTTYGRWGGFIDDVDKFDPFFFNIAVREAEQLDPQQRLFLESAWETVEHAGYGNRRRLRDANVGLFVGVMWNEYSLVTAEQGAFRDRYAGPGSLYWQIANRVSYFMDLTGPSVAIDTACSSSLTALHLACQSLWDGECGMAIAGGVNVSLHPFKYVYLGQLRFLSTDGKCRSFGDGGTGYVPGEGVGAVLLKPLDQALKDGDTIHAVIRGTSVNHGGRASGFTVPNPNQQAALVEAAFERAGVSPTDIGYVECHGTGTSLGDPIELRGLTQAFLKRGAPGGAPVCAIGSAKSSIGHLESAAGIAGLIKAVLTLQHGKIPPNLHSRVKNPNIDFASGPFYVAEQVLDFPMKEGSRFAGLSSFGAGGSNAHAILQWSSAWNTPSTEENAPELFVLSAMNPSQLGLLCRRLRDALSTDGTTHYALRDIAATLATGRLELAERLALVASTRQELLRKLDAALASEGLEASGVARGHAKPGGGERTRLAQWIQHRELVPLAEQWVRGAPVDLSALFEDRRWRRVALPSYPFERRRCWIPPASDTPSRAPAATLHPLVHSNVSTLREQRFATALTGEEFFLADHLVGGRKLLPAVASIEIARAAAVLSGESAHTLRDFVWMRPLVGDTSGCRFDVRLTEGDTDLEFALVGAAEDGDTVFARGRILTQAAPNPPPPAVDLRALRANATKTLSRDAVYGKFRSLGFDYGPTFQSIVEVSRTGQDALARLELPPGAVSAALPLNPALLDGALQTALVLLDDGGDGRSPPLPFALGAVEVHKTPTGQCWAWVRRNAAQRLEVSLLDESGQVLVSMRDLVLMRAQAEAGGTVPTAQAAPLKPTSDAALRTHVEEQLLAVYAELLKVSVEELDPEVPVSNYGVESVMMMTVLNRVEALFGKAVEPNAIVEHPAVRDFATHLIEEGVVTAARLNPEPAPVKAPPSRQETSASPLWPISPATAAAALPPQRVAITAPTGKERRIAVVAMSTRQPMSSNLEAFWRNLVAGRRLTQEVPRQRLEDLQRTGSLPGDLEHIRFGGFVEGIDLFDAGAFGIPDADALLMDPQQRILLELSRELFDAAGYRDAELTGRRVAVFVGGAESAYLRRHRASVPDASAGRMVLSTIQNMLAARISDHYGFTGWSQTVDTACSSSLVAIHQACRSLIEGEAEMAVAGGVELIIDPFYFTGFSRAGVLSDSANSYVFDERANGFVLGEGAGLVLLKPYEAALRDGDRIIALIAGSAVNNDGRTMGLTTPNQERQTELITEALRVSGLKPTDVTYLEAHGTGTLLGDPIEVRAATRAFGRGTERWCALGSVKSNVGHALHAAGVAAFLKTALAVERGLIPATLNCDRPHPRFRFEDSPFRPNTETSSWTPASGVRRAGISSFGFGGTNCHVILEQFTREGAPQTRQPLPETRFQRRAYWLGRAGEERLSRHDLLLRLSRGELTPDAALDLRRQMRTTD